MKISTVLHEAYAANKRKVLEKRKNELAELSNSVDQLEAECVIYEVQIAMAKNEGKREFDRLRYGIRRKA